MLDVLNRYEHKPLRALLAEQTRWKTTNIKPIKINELQKIT